MSRPPSSSSTDHSQTMPALQRQITGHPVDLEVAIRSFPQSEEAVLQVIDAPYDGTKPQVRAELSLRDNIEEKMKSLPRHIEGTARILDITTHSDFIITGLRDTKGPEKTRQARDGLIKFLQDTYTQTFEERRIFRWLSDPLHVNDIGSISSQWEQRLGDGKANFYRLVNRTSLQQDPLDYDLHPRDSYLTCAQDARGRLLVIIVNDVWSSQIFHTNTNTNKPHENDIIFQNPRTISSIRAGRSWTSLSDGTVDTFAKLLVLDFFLASIYLQPVDYYGPLIYSHLPEKKALKFPITKNPHLQVPLGLFEPRLSAKSGEAFREIEHAEGILRSVNNLVDSIKCVITALNPSYTGDTQKTTRIDYERRMDRLKELYEERLSNANRALNALNRQLDYLTKRHAIREAKAIKVLTILASLYLPLSLSASILGMSSPFKEVAHTQSPADQSQAPTSRLIGTNLLFDFFGVFIGLGAITIFIVYAIRLGLRLKSEWLGKLSKHFSGQFSILYYGRRWRFGGTGGRWFEFFQTATKWWVGAGMCITLLVIFLEGMLKGGQKAWHTAQWLFLAYCMGSLILSGCFAGTYYYCNKLRGG